MMNARNDRRAGYSLLEVIASAAVMGLLLNVIMGTMIAGGRLNATGVATLDRVRNAGDIRETFQRDVRTAARVAESVLEYQTGGNQLVLELPAHEQARRYVVYGTLKSEGRLDRLAFLIEDGNEPSIESFLTFPLDLEGFRVDTAIANLVSIELDADQLGDRPPPPGVRRKPPVTYRFTGAMRSRQGGAL